MKSIVVTGAGGGMGSATVSRLIDGGYRVIAFDKITDGIPEGAIAVSVDLTDSESIAAAVVRVKELTDELYAVLHFAGVYMLDSLVEIDEESLRKIFDVNLFGVMLLNKSLLPLLRRGSRILITTSELAPLDPLPFTGIYAVSKAALDKYAFSLAMELRLLGIGVSVLRAGAVNTDMLGVSMSALDRFCDKTELYTCNAERFKKIVGSIEARHITTDKLARKAVKILEKSKPGFAYSINRNPLLLILNMLPKRLQLWIISFILK